MDRLRLLKRHAPAFALGAVLLLHVALTEHAVPAKLVFGPTPVLGIDYDLHYQQTVRAVDFWRASGRTWGYDPFLQAGMPSGTINGHNKLIELAAIAGDEIGVPVHRSYNLAIWTAFLLVPLVIFGSARLFGASPAASVTAAFLGTAIWFFDAQARWFTYVGMIAWAGAAYLWLLPLALFWRWRESRRLPWLPPAAVLLAAVHLLHPYAFFALVVPMAVIYVRGIRELRWFEHAAVAGVALAAVLANLFWLIPAARVWHYVLDAGYYLGATPAYLLHDYFGLLKEPVVQGVIGQRTAFRFLVLAAAAVGIWRWRGAGDRRFLPFASGAGFLLFAAYAGVLLPGGAQIQPYRLLLPAIFLCVIPAAVWLVEAAPAVWQARKTPLLAGALLVAGILLVPRLGRDVLYFFPESVPRSEVPLPIPPPEFTGGPAFGSILWPRHQPFHIRTLDAEQERILRYVRDTDPSAGRWLVEWWELGERLASSTRAQVLGGFRELIFQHTDANLFRKYPDGAPPDPGELDRYLRRYNVRWVVVLTPKPAIENRTDLLEFVANVFGHRVYRVRRPGSWFEDEGPGHVAASVDRLRVRGSVGRDRVLRYHYFEGLVCRPGCELYRAPIENDRVGFIGVRNAPADFEIVLP
jgi:hypothetical protein